MRRALVATGDGALQNVRAAIDGLKLGRARCKIKKQCILADELLVRLWNENHTRSELFHKIRNF
jgi:hypothetical protein